MRPYSVDLRARIVFKHRFLSFSYEQVATDFAVSSRTVRRYVGRFNAGYGLLPRRDVPAGRRRVFSAAAMLVIVLEHSILGLASVLTRAYACGPRPARGTAAGAHQCLRELIEGRPDWRLDQLVKEMEAFTGVRVVPCTVHRAASRMQAAWASPSSA